MDAMGTSAPEGSRMRAVMDGMSGSTTVPSRRYSLPVNSSCRLYRLLRVHLGIAFRRSPNPGALDGSRLQRAAQLVDDERGQGLALDILRSDQHRRPSCVTCSRTGSTSCTALISTVIGCADAQM